MFITNLNLATKVAAILICYFLSDMSCVDLAETRLYVRSMLDLHITAFKNFSDDIQIMYGIVPDVRRTLDLTNE